MNDITFSGASIAIVTGLLGALAATIAMLFRLLMASKDSALRDMTSQRDSYQKMAAQSIAALELAANRARRARGEPPFQPIPAVVPEHNSPTTTAQIDTAEYQTLLARASRAGRILSIPIEDLNPDPLAGTEDMIGDNPTPAIAGLEPITLQAGESILIAAKLADDSNTTTVTASIAPAPEAPVEAPVDESP